MKQPVPLVLSLALVWYGLGVAAPAQENADRTARQPPSAEAQQAESTQRAQAAHQAQARDRVKRAESARRIEAIDRARLDHRHNHNHYYPARGHVIPALPSGSLGVRHGSGHFYFHGGVWFRPAGPRFIVSIPPIGIVIPILPPTYTTLWLGGVPYYYANGVYYASTRAQGYTVVAPPPDIEIAQPVPQAPDPASLPEQVIYPSNGQSAEQMEVDRQDCNRWAMTQAKAQSNASVFQRAIAACMEGRGYTVR